MKIGKMQSRKHWKKITLAYFQRWYFENHHLRIALMPQSSVAPE